MLILIFWFLPLKVPLVATLVSTIVAAGWVTAWIFRMHNAERISAHQPTANQKVYYPCKNPRQLVDSGDR